MARWFRLSEFTCKCGCGMNNIDPDFTDRLDRARTIAGMPFRINSGCRCRTHNKRKGGKLTSSHLRGLAVDIKATSSKARFKILHALVETGFTRIGIHKIFIHVDVDPNKPEEVVWLYEPKKGGKK